MFILNEDLNDFVLMLSLLSATFFLSLMMIAYGLRMKKLTILCLVLLMISGVSAIVHY
ncbi:hypothetical protein WP5S18E01_27120 [Enterobacter cloacae]|nr:hypothetical protein WP5S18E01_27120 [Enterobacter cloacae]